MRQIQNVRWKVRHILEFEAVGPLVFAIVGHIESVFSLAHCPRSIRLLF